MITFSAMDRDWETRGFDKKDKKAIEVYEEMRKYEGENGYNTRIQNK